MVSVEQIKAMRQRAVRFDAWLRAQLERRRPGASALWRPLDDQGGYLWLSFLERWLSGDRQGPRPAVAGAAPPGHAPWARQYRIYYYGSLVLTAGLFVSYSRLIFGASPLKTVLRRLLRRA